MVKKAYTTLIIVLTLTCMLVFALAKESAWSGKVGVAGHHWRIQLQSAPIKINSGHDRRLVL